MLLADISHKVFTSRRAQRVGRWGEETAGGKQRLQVGSGGCRSGIERGGQRWNAVSGIQNPEYHILNIDGW